jgi:alpha-galactosidase
MALLNRARTPRNATFDWRRESVADTVFNRKLEGPYHIRDLWAGADRGTTAQPFSATVPPHDVVLLLLTR